LLSSIAIGCIKNLSLFFTELKAATGHSVIPLLKGQGYLSKVLSGHQAVL
jgi:hypothetical protein